MSRLRDLQYCAIDEGICHVPPPRPLQRGYTDILDRATPDSGCRMRRFGRCNSRCHPTVVYFSTTPCDTASIAVTHACAELLSEWFSFAASSASTFLRWSCSSRSPFASSTSYQLQICSKSNSLLQDRTRLGFFSSATAMATVRSNDAQHPRVRSGRQQRQAILHVHGRSRSERGPKVSRRRKPIECGGRTSFLDMLEYIFSVQVLSTARNFTV